MTNQLQPRQSRAKTHFKFYSEDWLYGKVRVNLKPEERSVLVDFLCRASMNFGSVECYSRAQIARELNYQEKLINESIKKFIKLEIIILHKEESGICEIFEIPNWDILQADYLKKGSSLFCVGVSD